MATMNVSLPDEMKQWVEEQANSGRFGNSSDYIRDLIRRDQEGLAKLQALVDEARASGIVDMSPDELFKDIQRRNREKILATAEDIKAEIPRAEDAA